MPDFTQSQSYYRDQLFHGINSYVTIGFANEGATADVDVGYVEKIELNKNIENITETYIGLYGEPSFNAPSRVEYFGTIKKKLSDDMDHRGGREDDRESIARDEEAGFFTNSILNFKDGDIKGHGIKLWFNLKIYTVGKNQRMITTAEKCTITNHKRVIDKGNFVYDEYTFKFKKFRQQLFPH